MQAPSHQPLILLVFDLASIITVFMVNVMDDFGLTVSLFKYEYRSSNLDKFVQKKYQTNSYIVKLQGVLAGNSGGKKFQGCRNSM